MIRLHRKNNEGKRLRERVPAKKCNARALMLARRRRHTKTDGHYPSKKFSYKTRCIRCGVGMSYNKDIRRYLVKGKIVSVA